MKQITETFSLEFGFRNNHRFHIIARNYNEHRISMTGECLSTKDMRAIGNHLLQTADTIDADEIFNPK